MSDPRWQIHRHLAAETDSRVALLRRAPQRVVLHGADGNAGYALLSARYPNAAFAEYDHRADYLEQAAMGRQNGAGRLAKWFGSGSRVVQGSLNADEWLPPRSADMLFSNLMLPFWRDTAALLDNWAQALHDEGLLFFTCWGADSLPQWRQLFHRKGLRFAAAALPELHDLGDALLQHGFYDPIVDTARLVLSYQNIDALRQDAQTLGLWQALQPEHPAAAQAVVNEAFAGGGMREITLEIVCGHALKKTVLPDNMQPVQFYPRRDAA